jgi:hypothetical protein
MIRPLAFLLSLFLCLIATATFAQSPPLDLVDRVEKFIHSAIAKAAKSRWSKLSETEYSCVNQKLQERGDNLTSLIQKGVFPNDRRVASVRSQCRNSSSTSELFKRFDNHAYKRSGRDVVITVSNYHDCENACAQSSSCAALTFFRSEKICRMIQSATELTTDEGAESAIRTDSITGSVAPQTPSVTETTKSESAPTR